MKQSTRLKIVIPICAVIALLLLVGAIVFGALYMTHVDWGKIYNYYLDDSPFEYQYFYATIYDVHLSKGGDCLLFKVKIDSDDYLARYKGPRDEDNLRDYSTHSLAVYTDSYEKIKLLGFEDVVTEETVVKIYTHTYDGWHGWLYPVVGIEVGDTVFLDFETGKQNWLNYLKQRYDESRFQTPIKEK